MCQLSKACCGHRARHLNKMITGLVCATLAHGHGHTPDLNQRGNLSRSLLALTFHELPGVSNIKIGCCDAQSPFQSIPLEGITKNNNKSNSFFKITICWDSLFFLEFLFSHLRWSRCPTADTRKLQPTNCQLVQFLQNTVASWTPPVLQQSYTEKTLSKSQGESQVVLVIMLLSYLFPGFSTSFHRIKNKTPAPAVTRLTAPSPVPPFKASLPPTRCTHCPRQHAAAWLCLNWVTQTIQVKNTLPPPPRRANFNSDHCSDPVGFWFFGFFLWQYLIKPWPEFWSQ